MDSFEAGAPASPNIREQDWCVASERARIVRVYQDLRRQGMTLQMAAVALRQSPSRFSGPDSWLDRFTRDGTPGLLPRTRASGAKPRHPDFSDDDVQQLRAWWLKTNRTWRDGSLPEAARRFASDPACRPELRDWIRSRERRGLPMLPDRIARRVQAPEAVVRQFRNPTDAALDYLNSPGHTRFLGGRPIRSGDIIEPDDGTINFCVCVPWDLRGDPCSEKFGVKVGRFQLLLAVDAASGYVPAYSYVMRPRSSYRQEDCLHLYNIFMRQHGIPKMIRHEGGAWNGNRILDCLRLLNVSSHRTWSPHQKPYVEGKFNRLWTTMSALSDGQVGRYRGEMEAENDLLVSARRGSQDPRKHFPMLAQALAVIDQAIREANLSPCKSTAGRWVPAERWSNDLADKPLPALDPDMAWKFAPFCRDWKISQGIVGGRIPLFEDFSVPFDFAASFLPRYIGARIRAYFDPYQPRCSAMLTLAEEFRGMAQGELLGEAQQVNGIADYARLALGIGDGPDDQGRRIRQQQASALRREVRTLTGGPGSGLAVTEIRDGIDHRAVLDIDGAPASGPAGIGAPASGPASPRFAPSTDNSFQSIE
jgi:hypothetical protein